MFVPSRAVPVFKSNHLTDKKRRSRQTKKNNSRSRVKHYFFPSVVQLLLLAV